MPGPKVQGLRQLNRRNEMRQLNEAEVQLVDGGIVQLVVAALTIYAAADIAYDFAKGIREGYESTAN